MHRFLRYRAAIGVSNKVVQMIRLDGDGRARCAALVEFHQHAVEHDTSDPLRRIPVARIITIEPRS